MLIRQTKPEDLQSVMEIYAYAREFMKEHGNPRQWALRGWPPQALIEKDIKVGRSYVCVDDESGDVMGVFYYDAGVDIEPTYAVIEEGAWKDPSAYGVVHRIAAAEGTRGVGRFCIEWAYSQCGHLRIDTHPDNKVMQSLVKKMGFEYCGIIHVTEDNDPRFAYERVRTS